MHVLNFFIVPLILIGLFFRIEFSYVISLLCSLGAATFIYAQQSPANILFTIAIFNLTPLFCRRFNLIWRRQRFSLKAAKETAKLSYEKMQKESSIIRRSNFHLTEEAFGTSELYKMTRDMSAAADVRDAFNILGKRLTELFRFKKCRLILIDEEVGLSRIEKVFELKYASPEASVVDVEPSDSEILKQGFHIQKITWLDPLVLVPLTAENKFLGTLGVEGLSFDKLETFSTLANQFCLVMKKIKLYEKIQKLAINDGLTGLFVRRYILERLDEEIKRSARHHLHLAFLMIDIDRFKQCNDSFGHLTGDAVLKEVAGVIKSTVREIDLAARYGGEEFSVLLPDTGKAGAAGVAERIRANVDRHKFRAYNETIKTEVSIGVAVFPEDSTASRQLIDKSDQALYRAKQEGRNRVEIS